ncbi:MAG: GMC oxidoreductase [Pseudomonadota bacterium]
MKKITRREFGKRTLETGLAAGTMLSGLSQAESSDFAFTQESYEYIIIGSGAGGGPVAANLAKAGYSVLLLEAGEQDPADDVLKVPAFNLLSAEDPKLSWHFYVKHYSDQARAEKDWKYVPGKGILYPRASTLGGCTAHHAMITVYPQNNDFDRIAELTRDYSWDAYKMRSYFERLEQCQHVPRPWFPWFNPSRHGFDGWLKTNVNDITLLTEDRAIKDIVKAAALEADLGDIFEEFLSGNFGLDINNFNVAKGEEGAFLTPLAVNEFRQRHGVRELLLETQQKYPGKLTIKTNALATRILLDEQNTAVGVEYAEGQHLYRADAQWSPNAIPTALKQIRASREVILSGGAFNSPQLLKLSGIGPAQELIEHGIDVRVDLPGVGNNLQDRYEITVVNEMEDDVALLKECTFGATEDDPCLKRYYDTKGGGPYGTNGNIFSIVKRSQAHLADPDLYVFGSPADFRGYYPGFSQDAASGKNYFSWVVLKGHTNNTAGSVNLKSNDPFEVPEINFRYFDEGNDTTGDDLAGVVEGTKLARSIMDNVFAKQHVAREVYPGAEIQSDEQMGEVIKNDAWGHHASCTNPIGVKGDPKAVLDSDFRVYGTKNLRVVDASIFPYIPGFFIVTSVYLIAEKASDVILNDARK